MGEAHESEAKRTPAPLLISLYWVRPCVEGEALNPTRSADLSEAMGDQFDPLWGSIDGGVSAQARSAAAASHSAEASPGLQARGAAREPRDQCAAPYVGQKGP